MRNTVLYVRFCGLRIVLLGNKESYTRKALKVLASFKKPAYEQS